MSSLICLAPPALGLSHLACFLTREVLRDDSRVKGLITMRRGWGNLLGVTTGLQQQFQEPSVTAWTHIGSGYPGASWRSQVTQVRHTWEVNCLPFFPVFQQIVLRCPMWPRILPLWEAVALSFLFFLPWNCTHLLSSSTPHTQRKWAL